eukprot:562103-Lingulodinium_polyedra.AAC.1
MEVLATEDVPAKPLRARPARTDEEALARVTELLKPAQAPKDVKAGTQPPQKRACHRACAGSARGHAAGMDAAAQLEEE